MAQWIDARRGRAGWWVHAVLAAVAYVPLLLTGPGQLSADTKQYLYLEPGRLLSRAPYLWDQNVGLGTVTHQNIGYLWPMGPFFFVFDRLGVPDWVAQRLWSGTILFAAGAGLVYLLSVLHLRGVAPVGAALVYMLSPFTLGYMTGASAILLPFVALPWLVAFTAQAARRGGWRFPALVALVATSAGSINGSSVVYVALGPVLWLPFAVWVTRETTWRRAAGAGLRIAGLVVLTQMWWIVALLVGGEFGLPLLRTTETVDQVSATSTGPEVLRGLGYWFFYGGDNIGQWLGFATPYMQAPWLLVATFAIPVLGIAAGATLRWRHRAYFAVLAATGLVLAVGAHPTGGPSLAGRAFREASRRSDLVLSLRNAQRAVPLVALGFAVLIGAGLGALATRRRLLALGTSGLVGVVAGVGLAPLFSGDLIAGRFHREDIPRYWETAVSYLDAQGHETRVLELPGSDFAAYRWGNTLDPITPGMTDRSVVARELVPFGSPASVSLLNALDRRIQEGQLEPQALAPLSRLVGAGSVLFRFDLEYERYRTPRPWVLWDLLTPTPPGLREPVSFGEPVPNRAAASVPMVDEITLATTPGQSDPPPVVVFPVEGVPPLVRARPVVAPIVLAGDGEGVVEAASAGIVDGSRPLLYSGDVARDRETLRAVLDAGADLVLTDTNRRTAQRWFTLRENSGYTETAGEEPLARDATDARLAVFPKAGDDARTVSIAGGGVQVKASGYGNPVSYVPDSRPALAADGDLQTAWLVGGFSEAIGERVRLEFDEPVTTDHAVLIQPQRGALNRWITKARLTFDGATPLDAVLGDRSRSAAGERIEFPGRTFRRLEIEITDTDLGRRRTYHGVSGVGFAEIGVAGRTIDEVERLPVDLLRVVPDALDHRLTIVMARRRANPAEPVRADPEQAMARMFGLPEERSFLVTGTARLSAYASDHVLDRLVGVPAAAEGGLTASSSGRLPGDLGARASAAADGDVSTHWSPGFLDQVGHWIDFEVAEPLTFDHLDLRVVADGRHSVPTELVLETDTGETRVLRVPALADGRTPDAVARAAVAFPSVTGRSFRFTVSAVREVRTRDWYSETRILMPVGIAEIGIPGLRAPAPAAQVDTGCRDDLMTLDGKPLPVRVTGDVKSALGRDGLALEGCGEPVRLETGDHVVRAGLGRDDGIDVDRLVLRSDRGGGPAAPGPTAPRREPAPEVRVTGSDRVGVEARVDARAPFFFVLAQSANRGWVLDVSGGRAGDRRIVDGFANGWLVVPDGSGPVTIAARWTPQTIVWAGLGVSALAVSVCVALLVVGRRGESANRGEQDAATDGTPALTGPWERVAVPPRPWPVAFVASAVVGVVAAVVSVPWVGAVVGGASLLALRLTRPGLVTGLPALGAAGVTASVVVAGQIARSPAADFAWPKAFDPVHWPAVSCVLLLAVGAIADGLRRADRLERHIPPKAEG